MAYLTYILTCLLTTSDEIRSENPGQQMGLLLVIWRLIKRVETGDGDYITLVKSLDLSRLSPEVSAMLYVASADSPEMKSLLTHDFYSKVKTLIPLDPPLDLSSQFAVPYSEYDAVGILTKGNNK